MPTLERIRYTWTGLPVVGPSVTTFYAAAPGTGAVAALNLFFSAFLGAIPSGVTITPPVGGDTIDSATGDLVGSWSGGGGSPLLGENTTGFILGVGVRVKWNTAGLFHGRRVRGATFIVPMAKGAYATDGTIESAIVTAGTDAAQDVVAADVGLGVWSRPRAGAADGVFSPYTSGSLPDAVSWLRTRRL